MDFIFKGSRALGLKGITQDYKDYEGTCVEFIDQMQVLLIFRKGQASHLKLEL